MIVLLGFLIPAILMLISSGFYCNCSDFILIIWNCLPFYLLCKFARRPLANSKFLSIEYIPFYTTYIGLLAFVAVTLIFPKPLIAFVMLEMPIVLSILMVPFYWMVKAVVIGCVGVKIFASKVDRYVSKSTDYNAPTDEKHIAKRNNGGLKVKIKTSIPITLCLFLMIGVWWYFSFIRINNIYDAILLGKNQDVQKFIEKGIDLNSIDPEWGSPLYSACRFGEIETVEYILSFDVDVNLGSVEGMTPLMAAAKRGKVDVVKLLLSYDADCQLVDNKGNSALYYAKNERKYEIEKLLNDAGCD